MCVCVCVSNYIIGNNRVYTRGNNQLSENETLGRHYVAIRNIEAGEIVIREDDALVQGPQQDSVPVCLGCNIPLAAETAKPCELCGWPLCENCTTHGSECEFTRKYKESKVIF